MSARSAQRTRWRRWRMGRDIAGRKDRDGRMSGYQAQAVDGAEAPRFSFFFFFGVRLKWSSKQTPTALTRQWVRTKGQELSVALPQTRPGKARLRHRCRRHQQHRYRRGRCRRGCRPVLSTPSARGSAGGAASSRRCSRNTSRVFGAWCRRPIGPLGSRAGGACRCRRCACRRWMECYY